MKKRKKNGETEKKEDTWKNIKNEKKIQKSNGVKKRGDTELECKTGVKHNSKLKTIHFQKKNLFVGEKGSQQKESKKQVDISIRRVFFCSKKLKNTKREMRKETPKRKEKTQNNLNQMENGTRKTCVQKNIIKRKEKNTKRTKWTKKRRRTNEEKCKEEDHKPEQMSKKFFLQKKKKERKKKRRITK